MHIETRRKQVSGLQRRNEGCFVNDGPASRIDDPGAGLHGRQECGVD